MMMATGVRLMLVLVSVQLAAAKLGVSSVDSALCSTCKRQENAVRQLLRRRLPAHADDFDLEVTPPPGAAAAAARDEADGAPEAPVQQFTVAPGTVPGRVALTGTSGVALASALNHYLKYDAGMQINVWFTSQTKLADGGGELPRPTTVNITSPYRFQNYLNICAFGYSTAWYSWSRWQEEIDWMALNGVVNPLAMVGQDAIWLDVFTEDFGLSKAELLDEFFAGPTFQPWHWMGNLNGWGGPVDEAFLRQQHNLQRNITTAMVEFGMQPVLPAFAGHVPKGMAAKFPEANITQLSPWHGHFPVGTFFLSPSSPAGSKLFQSVGEKFIQRQASSLGVMQWTGGPHYYLADAYNEMPPPTTNTTFLSSVSKSMYDSMASTDSQALMVTQGWFLSNVPALPWGVDQARAFLHGPPQGRLLVLDLNAIENPVWNRTESFYGVPFALCMLHNFGERPGLFGRLPELATAPPEALRDSVPGTMVGTGMTPEGTNTNPIVYDLYAEMFWHGHTAPQLDKWVSQYYRRRYGLSLAGGHAVRSSECEAHAAHAWSLLKQSVYSAPIEIKDEQGATGSDMAARPMMSGGRIPDTIDSPFYSVTNVEVAWRELLECTSELGDSVDGYAYDIVAVGRQVLSDRFNAQRVAFAHAAASPNMTTWQCVHFNQSDDAKCNGLSGSKQMDCESAVCASKGGKFSHDEHSNRDFPGCGSCWCCTGGIAPPASPANLTQLKRTGTALLGLIDDMDRLLASHHAFLLGTWLRDAEQWAEQASTEAHGITLMEDARRVITLWGHPNNASDPHDSHLSQYSYRLWAGLVSRFYRPRWATFISAVIDTVSRGDIWSVEAQHNMTRELMVWEEAWVANASNTAASFGTTPSGSPTSIGAELCKKHSICTTDDSKDVDGAHTQQP